MKRRLPIATSAPSPGCAMALDPDNAEGLSGMAGFNLTRIIFPPMNGFLRATRAGDTLLRRQLFNLPVDPSEVLFPHGIVR